MADESSTKANLRKQIAQRLQLLDASNRAAAAAKARLTLEKQAQWMRAESIFFYAPLPSELDVWPLLLDALNQGKAVFLPRFSAEQQRYVPCRIRHAAEDVQAGRFGIREPRPHCDASAANQLDLILVPGVAFDTRGNRLGRGKGFYDRLLADAVGCKCGAAFDEQIVPAVPVEPHDVAVDCIVTPARWIEVSSGPVLE